MKKNRFITPHFEVIPGILEHDTQEILKKIETVKPFVSTIQIDVIDGIFASNTTVLDPQVFAPYTKDIPFEVHLMVNDPLQYVQPFADAGFTRFIGHIEKMPSQIDFVAAAEEVGEVGLALDIDTPVDAITAPFMDLDFVFVMTVKAGFSHQEFVHGMLEKVKEIRRRDDFMPIEIDGGVNEETIVQAKEAGATRFVTTGYIFNNDSPKANYLKLLKELK